MKIVSSTYFPAIFMILFTLIPDRVDSESYLWRKHDIPANRTNVLDMWNKIDSGIKSIQKSLTKKALPSLLKLSNKIKLSPRCQMEALQLAIGLQSSKIWALQFVDATAKIVDGLATGTSTNLGIYDECVAAVVPKSRPKNSDDVLSHGQYCTVDIRLPLPFKTKRYRSFDQIEELKKFNGSEELKLAARSAHFFYFKPFTTGVCVPSGCTIDDVNNVVQLVARKTLLDMDVSRCETKKEIEITGFHAFVICLCVLLVILVVLGTLLDVCIQTKTEEYNCLKCSVLLCFSVITNFKRIITTKTLSTNLKCLNGFRFLSIAWVVLGHSYFYPGWYLQAYNSTFFIRSLTSAPFAQIICNASEVVDSFFTLSGLLLGYLTIKYVKIEKNRFAVIPFIFHRLWRIAPTYYFVLLFAMLTPLMGSGPMHSDIMEDSIYTCYRYWWRNFLFINNYFSEKDICLMHTWYISVDMQLYLSSIPVILAFKRSGKLGIAINIFIVLASVIYSGTITALKDLAPTLIQTHQDPDDRLLAFSFTYANTLSRAGPYYIGFFVGYLLVTKPSIKMSKKIQVIGWCLATLSSGLVIYATALWFNVRPPTPIEVLVYAAVYKVAFSAGLAWMLFCCITGHGGMINTFLSWKLWVPLSKLSFLIYLIQPVFQTNYIANFKSTQDYNHLQMVMQFFGFLCISSLLAMVCNLLVESPCVCFEKMLLSPKKKEEIFKGDLIKETSYVISNDYTTKIEKDM